MNNVKHLALKNAHCYYSSKPKKIKIILHSDMFTSCLFLPVILGL